jgi:hypothetical protein
MSLFPFSITWNAMNWHCNMGRSTRELFASSLAAFGQSKFLEL